MTIRHTARARRGEDRARRRPGGQGARRRIVELQAWAFRHEYIAAVLVLGFLLCAFFFPMLTGDQLGQSHILWTEAPFQAGAPDVGGLGRRFSEGDEAHVFYPLGLVVRNMIHAGQVPFWNPYSYAGNVLLGDMQTAVLFPLTWIGWILPLAWAWGIICVLKLLVAGMGAYVLSRHWGIGRAGGLVAATAFMFCAPMLVWMQWPLATVFAMLPWLILAADRVFQQPDRRWVAVLGIVVGLSILAGHPESALLNSLAATVFLLTRVVLDEEHRRSLRRSARVVGAWLAGNLLGAAVSAAVVIPFYEAFVESINREAHGAQATSTTLNLWQLLAYGMPTLYASGDKSVWLPYRSFATLTSVSVYFGLGMLLLAVVGFARYRRRPVCIAMAAMAVVSLLALFGLPPVTVVTRNIWPLSTIVMQRVYIYVALVGAVGAGAGVHTLMKRPVPSRKLIDGVGLVLVALVLIYVLERLAGQITAPGDVRSAAVLRSVGFFVIGLACVWALGRFRSSVVVAVIIVVAVLDMSYLRQVNVWLPPDQAHPAAPPSVMFLQRAQRASGPFRISGVRPATNHNVLIPNESALFGLESIEGYDPPTSARWAHFAHDVLGQGSPLALEKELMTTDVISPEALRSLRMMNVEYYLAATGQPAPNPELRPVYRGDDAVVWRDPHVLPRAYVVGRVRPMPEKTTFDTVKAGAYNPRAEALVPLGASIPPGRPSGFRRAVASSHSNDEVRVSVPQGPAGWLVLANAYSPQWKAEVDGQGVEIRPTNSAAMGVPIDPGAHVVKFTYDASGFNLGVVISILACGLIALGLTGWRPSANRRG